jgi:putative nucleotidyltransferase with HDIG domain
VAEVAIYLAQRLRKAGQAVNLDLVERAALLHDLDKIATLEGPVKHGEASAEFLRQQGYPALAHIIERHLFGSHMYEYASWSWETLLVHYADKLCIGTRVVTLDERLSDLAVRYPQFRHSFDHFEPLERQIERMILKTTGLTPAEIAARWHNADAT